MKGYPGSIVMTCLGWPERTIPQTMMDGNRHRGTTSPGENKMEPKSRKDVLDRVEALLKSGQPQDALTFLEKIGYEPDDLQAQFLLGIGRKMTGDLAGAEVAFRKLLGFQPQHDGALYGLGLLQEAKGNLPEAIGLWREALRNNPRHAGAAHKLQERQPSAPTTTSTPTAVHQRTNDRPAAVPPSTPPHKQLAPKTRPSQTTGPKAKGKRAGGLKLLLGLILWLIIVGIGGLMGFIAGESLWGSGGGPFGAILGLIAFHIVWIFVARKRF